MNTRNFEDLRLSDQMKQVNQMGDEMMEGKLKLGQLLRMVRSQDWQKLDRKEWESIQSL